MQSISLIEIRPNRRINVYQWQNGKTKTLFFLHGFGGHYQQWQAQIDYFKKDYNIIAPDWLGLGESDKPEKENYYTFNELYDDNVALLQRFATAENDIIGHSYGCTFTLHLAANLPTLVNKIVLITPMAFPYDLGLLKVFQMPIFMLKTMQPMMTKQFFHAAFMEQTDPAIIEQEVIASNKNSMAIIKETALDIHTIKLPDLQKVTEPTLIILTDHDRITSSEQSLACFKTIPNVKFVTIENAAHMVILEQPAQINKLITDFIS